MTEREEFWKQCALYVGRQFKILSYGRLYQMQITEITNTDEYICDGSLESSATPQIF